MQKEKFIFVFITLIFFGSTLNAQKDSTVRKYYSVSTGFLHYASVDEIFTPYIYSGTSAYYDLGKRVFSKKDIREYTYSFAYIPRKPLNLKPIERFFVTGYDGGSFYLSGEKAFQKQNTYIISSHMAYLRSIQSLSFYKLRTYAGFSNDINMSMNGSITSPELFSLSFNPSLLLYYQFNDKFWLTFSSSISLVGMNIRMPYAGTIAQITDYYDTEFYVDYTLQYLSFDFIPNYFRNSSALSVYARLSNKVFLAFNYQLQYLNLTVPRRLTATSDMFNLSLNLKFR